MSRTTKAEWETSVGFKDVCEVIRVREKVVYQSPPRPITKEDARRFLRDALERL